MFNGKLIEKIFKLWNGWGMVIMWVILAILLIPLPILIDKIVRYIFNM